MATVYIPTLSGGEKLAACLDSLLVQTVECEVVVADNGPGEGARELLASYPEVTRVAFGRNLGFGPGLNRAIAQAGRGPIILLNDDAVADPSMVEAMLESAGSVETVAGVLLSSANPARIDSAGVLVDQTAMGFDYLSGEPVSALVNAPSPAGPTGGAGLYSRTAFEAVGGFDERIFLYYEDVDLALRIRANGGSCQLAPDARATHGYSETLGARSPEKYARTGWSRGYLLRRYGVMRNPRLGCGALGREIITCAGQILHEHTLAGAKGRLLGWRDARGLPTLMLEEWATTPMSVRRAMELRRRRHSV